MATERLSMRKTREILRHKWLLGRSHRQVRDSVRVSLGAINGVLTRAKNCRIPVLGGHVDLCEACAFATPAYNSCRNRHWPKCQALTQAAWGSAQRPPVNLPGATPASRSRDGRMSVPGGPGRS